MIAREAWSEVRSSNSDTQLESQSDSTLVMRSISQVESTPPSGSGKGSRDDANSDGGRGGGRRNRGARPHSPPGSSSSSSSTHHHHHHHQQYPHYHHHQHDHHGYAAHGSQEHGGPGDGDGDGEGEGDGVSSINMAALMLGQHQQQQQLLVDGSQESFLQDGLSPEMSENGDHSHSGETVEQPEPREIRIKKKNLNLGA